MADEIDGQLARARRILGRLRKQASAQMRTLRELEDLIDELESVRGGVLSADEPLGPRRPERPRPAGDSHVRFEQSGGFLSARFSEGHITGGSPFDNILKRLEGVREDRGTPFCIINMAGVTGLDDRALAGITTLSRTAIGMDGLVVLCHLEPPVTEQMRSTHLDRMILIVDDHGGAVRFLSSRQPNESTREMMIRGLTEGT